jgi:transposase
MAQIAIPLIDRRVKRTKQRIRQVCDALPICQTLLTVPGVGPMVATALYATMGSPHNYRNGRGFAALLGLVPQQHSTGGKTVLRGISKRGGPHLRTLLVQGAQAAMRHMHKRDDAPSQWACKVKAKKAMLKLSLR